MSRVAYVNGRYLPHREARVHVEDRGFQFADGVYEVIAVEEGGFVDEHLHLARLTRSLGELRIAPPMAEAALKCVMREVIRRNAVRDGFLYLQITRGAAPRDFAFPAQIRPSLVMTARRRQPANPGWQAEGVAVVTHPDLRWARRDIKAVGLLPSVLAKQKAKESGAYEAWLVDGEGRVTEGASSNAWIVTAAGEVVTHPADHDILNGVTRLALLHLLAQERLDVAERRFSVGEARAAREAFLTSTTNGILPVTRIDGAPVGDGRPGPLSRRLSELYRAYAAHHGQDR